VPVCENKIMEVHTAGRSVSGVAEPEGQDIRLMRVRLTLSVAGIIGVAALVAWLITHFSLAAVPRFANADDDATVERGKRIYRFQCSSCHGRYLQGQSLWQLNDKDAGRRAPAHDETGHTWQHSDEALFQKTKYGRFEPTRTDLVTYMPAFKDVLSDADTLAVIAFIKRRWPVGLRVSQAMLNPGYAGIPADATRVEWKLPPTCGATLVR
jgi:S-disulfanyl-L-cysteine oxidoreductase SoxD